MSNARFSPEISLEEKPTRQKHDVSTRGASAMGSRGGTRDKRTHSAMSSSRGSTTSNAGDLQSRSSFLIAAVSENRNRETGNEHMKQLLMKKF